MKIAILGAGTVGASLAKLFCESPSVNGIVVIDQNGNALAELQESCPKAKLRTYKINIQKEHTIISLIKGFDCLVSALPYEYNPKIAELAVRVGINYIDLGGNDAILEKQLVLDDEAKSKNLWIIPNCGMAPGLVNILAMHGFEEFDEVDSISIWASSLPKQPIPPFNYQVVFSPIGLVHEYFDPVSILQNGKITTVDPLEGYEKINFESEPELGDLEAFYVSGSITSLVKELEGKVKELSYKTIRYPGHRDIMKALKILDLDSTQIIDIRTNLTYQDILVRQIQKNLPRGDKDIVLIKMVIEGLRNGEPVQRVYELIHENEENSEMSSLMSCATIPIVIISEMIMDKELIGKGGVNPPESIVPKDEFIKRLKDKGLEVRITETVLSVTEV